MPAKELANTIKRLAPRWFVMRNAHAEGTLLLHPRWAMSFLRGPMTRTEIKRALKAREPPPAVPEASEACTTAT